MTKDLLASLRPAAVALLAFTVLTGVVYPAIVLAVGQAAFSHTANGSLVVEDGRVVGSELIGQPFTEPRYFWSRPSATAPFAYNAMASAGANLAVSNPARREAVAQRVAELRAADPGNTDPVPLDLVTASGSGLDPDISPAAARFQVGRVARARGLPLERVRALVDAHVQGRTSGILGEPRVNVAALNRALDALR
ncbi:MAG: potassium-transporting ATPase subunit KdpC [Deltaproteobacteria bacterium]|nr:potassium-transporting ATPase subunit KdpC [Deltaproteobacteria bacterium]